MKFGYGHSSPHNINNRTCCTQSKFKLNPRKFKTIRNFQYAKESESSFLTCYNIFGIF